MRTSSKRKRLILAGLVASPLLVVPAAIWLSLTHQPTFYRALTDVPRDQREAKARRFVASSLQLRNDISNERDWQAVFTDQEVNAWLADDLVTHFADQIPPEIHEPRVAFGVDRITLAFQLDRGPIRSVIWVVAQARVPEDNVLALTLEKIRAGVIPISAERLIGPITDQAREHGLDVKWTREGGLPVALIRYKPDRRPVRRRPGEPEHPPGPDPPLRPFRPPPGDLAPPDPARPAGSFSSTSRGETPSSDGPPTRPSEAPPSRPADPPGPPAGPVLAPLQDLADAPIPSPDRPPPARDLPLVIQIDPPMRRQFPGREVDPLDDRRVDRPGPERRAVLDQEVPVDPVPSMLQDREPTIERPHLRPHADRSGFPHRPRRPPGLGPAIAPDARNSGLASAILSGHSSGSGRAVLAEAVAPVAPVAIVLGMLDDRGIAGRRAGSRGCPRVVRTSPGRPGVDDPRPSPTPSPGGGACSGPAPC